MQSKHRKYTPIYQARFQINYNPPIQITINTILY